MEIKDVVKGKRVKVIADSDNLIPIGAIGTLIESGDSAPYVNLTNTMNVVLKKMNI